MQVSLNLSLSFQIIKNLVKTRLHEKTLEEFRLYCIPYEIQPGQTFCFCYKYKIFVDKKENENVNIEHENENNVMETDKISHEAANQFANQSLVMLECSYLKVLRKPNIP